MFPFLFRKTDKKPADTSSPADPLYLKKVNEEIYKKNFELADKNRTLSLLYKLYDITIHTYGLLVIARELAEAVQMSEKLPFFGLAVFEGGKKKLRPLIGCTMDEGKPLCIFESEADKDAFGYADDEMRDVCLSIEKRRALPKAVVAKIFQRKIFENGFFKNRQPGYFYAFSLSVNKNKAGIMIVGTDAPFSEMKTAHSELIENVANVIAVSLENAIIYDDLRLANARLQELDRQKTEFLSIASHQLRTPLSIIKGYNELLTDGAYGLPTTEMKEIFKNIDESNERLIKLVDEFLDISRIEQGRTKFSFSESDLEEIVQSVIKEIEPKATGKNLKINHIPPTKPVRAQVDGDKVRHIIYNFVDNAVKYTETGEVRVELSSDQAGVYGKVTDTGIGFMPDDGASFFQKFYRGKNVQGTNVTGTGLGIYVCRQFAEGHGGRVWANSPGRGQGSEFGFFLPFVPNPQKKEEISGASGIVNQYGGESA